MMCDNSPTIGPSVSDFDPPTLQVQPPPHPRRQHHHQQQQWSPLASSSRTTPTDRDLLLKFDGRSGHGSPTSAAAATAATTTALPCPVSSSPPRKRRASADPSAAYSSSFSPAPAGHRAHAPIAAHPAPWHRSDSAPNLENVPCRIHATPNAGCRTCCGGATVSAAASAATSAAVTATTATSAPGRRRCSVAISAPAPASRPTPGGGSRGRGHPAASSAVGKGPLGTYDGGSVGDNNVDVDDSGYLGPGKRVWEKRAVPGSAGGVGGGSDLLGQASSSSCVTPAGSYFFPSAAAAAAAAAGPAPGVGSGAPPPCPPVKRRIISAEPAPASITDEQHAGRRKRKPESAQPGARSTPIADELMSNGGGDIGGGSGSGGGGGGGSGSGGGRGGVPRSSDDLEKLVLNLATRGMQQALQYGLRHSFSLVLQKKVCTVRYDTTRPAFFFVATWGGRLCWFIRGLSTLYVSHLCPCNHVTAAVVMCNHCSRRRYVHQQCEECKVYVHQQC